MSVKAIVYTSETGFTAEYANMLSDETGLPAMPLDMAEKSLPKGEEIVYMSWLMAGNVKELKNAAKYFCVKAVCAVGLLETGTLTDKIRRQNKIADDVPLFTVQGGYSPEKLHGMYRFLMNIVTKTLVKKIDNNPNKTESDYRMRKVLTVGGSLVSRDNISAVADYLHEIAE